MDKNMQTAEQAIGEMMKREQEEKVKRFQHLNPYVKKGQILFAGSSLMEQFPIYEFLQDFSLPYVIYNRAIGGYTTSDLLENLEDCIYNLEPRFIFMNIGSNDLNGADFDLEGLLLRYRQILQGIQEHLPKTQLFLMGYYPVNPEAAKSNPWIYASLQHRTNQRIWEVNQHIEKLAEEFHAIYLNVNAGITDENGNLKKEYTIEGMHMYANGYEPILKAMLPVLENIKKQMEEE